MPRKESVAIIGLGYVGLPIALLAKQKGLNVFGVDIDHKKIDLINTQKCPWSDKDISRDLKKYPFPANTDYSSIQESDYIIIAVPTPVTARKQPNLTPLTKALKGTLNYLKGGQTIIIESTINPGVMDEVILPILRERKDLNIDADHKTTNKETIYLAHCPERINPGDPKWTVRNIPRVLGGYSPSGTKKALSLYKKLLDAPIKVMSSPTEAEAVKILENTFRDINIAYINEMAKSFDALGIDIMDVIEGAATKPFAFLPHYPGNGVGGHCISVDPYYMIERARQVGFDHKFLKLARAINDSMPQYCVDLLIKHLPQAKLNTNKVRVAVLGVSYKKDVSDLRNSPALDIIKMLRSKKINTAVYDPLVPSHSTAKSLTEALKKANAVVLSCDHTDLVKKLSPQTLSNAGIKIVIDGKNALSSDAITKHKIIYHGIGHGNKPT
jgi:nucleotide sugar dehydrogenase